MEIDFQMNWRDINHEKPQDHQLVLCWDPVNKLMQVQRFRIGPDGYWWWTNQRGYDPIYPSHWMPIPEPPTG